MNRHSVTHIAEPDGMETEAADVSVPRLVGEVYAAAPAAERSRLIEHLLRPLGVLSLAVVANGIFSKLLFLSGWPRLHIQPDLLDSVRAEDVIALVEYVQQASWEVMDGLVQVLTDSPVMSATAGAALLIAVLLRRARTRDADAPTSDL